MARTDTHLDGMLRHLGAAYYDSLHGRATQADVTRAVDSVAKRLNEQGEPAARNAPVTLRASTARSSGTGRSAVPSRSRLARTPAT
jgi:hypothetical protein